MAKKKSANLLKGKSLSQALIAATVIVILVAVYQASTQNDITHVAPTQLLLLAVVLGILALFVKDEK